MRVPTLKAVTFTKVWSNVDMYSEFRLQMTLLARCEMASHCRQRTDIPAEFVVEAPAGLFSKERSLLLFAIPKIDNAETGMMVSVTRNATKLDYSERNPKMKMTK